MEGGGVRGHILNCGKTATNTCIIMLRLSLANPGNSAIVYIYVLKRIQQFIAIPSAVHYKKTVQIGVKHSISVKLIEQMILSSCCLYSL